MLVELRVVEQRYRAVLEVLDGASVTRWPAVSGCRGRRCMRGCGGMPPMAGLGDRSSRPMAVRIRWPGGGGPDCGDPAGASGVGCGPIGYQLDEDGMCRCRVGRQIYRALVRQRSGEPGRRRDGGRIIGGGNGRGRWSCGRWTWWAASTWPTGPRLKIVSGIDDHSRFVVSAQVVARATAGRRVRRWRRRCAGMGCRSRS